MNNLTTKIENKKTSYEITLITKKNYYYDIKITNKKSKK